MKRSYLIVLFLITLILAIISGRPIWKPYLDSLGITSSSTRKILSSSSEVNQIEIILSEDQKFTLAKTDNSWKINEYSADKAQVELLLNELSGVSLTDDLIVSTNPNHQDKYSVSDSGYRLMLHTNQHTQEVIVGENYDRPLSYYLRIPGTNEVYLLTGQVYDLVTNTLSDWRDKEIISVEPTQISQIDIHQDSGPISISKTEAGTWQAVQGTRSTTLGEVTASRLIESFNPLKAEGFIEAEQESVFANTYPQSTLTLIGPDGKDIAKLTVVFEPNSQQWWLKVSGQDQIYQVSSLLVSDIFLDPKNLF